jgi:phytoene synthase
MSAELGLISRAGKTFYFATRWLEKGVRDDTVLTYNFCRTVDDIADSRPAHPDRDARLRAIARAVRQHDGSHELVFPLLPVIDRYPEIQEPLVALVDACREDLPTLRIDNEQDLARYAHGVAGNVGLIMYPILGGRSPAGRTYAADLGIAMQYTNIARDFREDRAHGRVYLPHSWLAGRDPRDLLDRSSNTEENVVGAVQQLLMLADARYARGLSGLHFLSPGNRFAIRVAATCYAAIGNRVIRNGRLAHQRAVVPFSQKILLACQLGLFSSADAR